MVYVLLVGGASPHVTTSELTLSLLVMVVLGGPGTRWGPVLGGILYMYLDHRLTSLVTPTYQARWASPSSSWAPSSSWPSTSSQAA